MAFAIWIMRHFTQQVRVDSQVCTQPFPKTLKFHNHNKDAPASDRLSVLYLLPMKDTRSEEGWHVRQLFEMEWVFRSAWYNSREGRLRGNLLRKLSETKKEACNGWNWRSAVCTQFDHRVRTPNFASMAKKSRKRGVQILNEKSEMSKFLVRCKEKCLDKSFTSKCSKRNTWENSKFHPQGESLIFPPWSSLGVDAGTCSNLEVEEPRVPRKWKKWPRCLGRGQECSFLFICHSISKIWKRPARQWTICSDVRDNKQAKSFCSGTCVPVEPEAHFAENKLQRCMRINWNTVAQLSRFFLRCLKH